MRGCGLKGSFVVSIEKRCSIFKYREEGDSTKGEWMLRICLLDLGVVSRKD